MNEAKKFQFKVELALNLKSAKDIQNWAVNTLEKNPTDLLALEICFFSKDEEVLDYFHNINIEQSKIEPTLKKIILWGVLKKYIEKPLPIEYSKELIFNLFVILLDISRYAEDEYLYDFITHYDDEFYLSLKGISILEPEEVWPTFLNDLKNWLLPKLRFI
ncbi:hypothetical protein AY606_15470 [Acinetobacter sp. SFB]|uniref:hypothetical protein n=1 Tax=Acinetobacter sp. SFB TaxID=1805634 RepID=UPI0007D7BA8C|nr:hypothetical protein [Acinetobacter sp. SFB]OAL80417.1 hypothetical protein AY606_15470 [Acinetobacter sp. SFB]